MRRAWLRWLLVPWSEFTLAVTVVAAAAVPVFLVASASVWGAAAEDDVAARAVEFASLERNGLDVVHETAFDADGTDVADAEISAAVARIPEAMPVDRTLYTLPDLFTIGSPVRQVGPTARLLARDGALESVEIVDQLDDTAGGVWISTWLADRHGLGLGDGVGFEASALGDDEWDGIVQGGGGGSVFIVVGLYEPIWSADRSVELDPYWQSVPPQVIPRFLPTFNRADTTLILTDEETLLGSGLTGIVHWRAPLTSLPDTFDGLRLLRSRVRAFELGLVGSNGLGDAVSAIAASAGERPRLTTEIYDTTDEVIAAVRELDNPVESTRAVGAAVGLVGMVAVGLFLVERRRSEFRLLASEGERWLRMSVRVAGQLFLPTVLGSTLGLLGALYGLWWFGPAKQLETASMSWSALGTAGLVALVVAAVAAGVAGARTLRRIPPNVARAIEAAFAVSLILATLFAWAQVGRRSAAGDVDVAIVALPVLTILLVVAAALAVAGWAIRVAGSFAERLPVPGFLAVRRLATGALGLRAVSGTIGLGVGLLVFAIALSSTLDSTVEAKLAAEIGGESTVSLTGEPPPEFELPVDTTLVRTFDTVVTPGGERVRLLAVDFDTWADAVTWPEAFGSDREEVERLLDRELDGAVPAVAINGERAPSRGAFGLTITYGYEVVGRVDSLPGAGANESTLLVSATAINDLALAEAGFADAEVAAAANFRLPTDRFRRQLVSQLPVDELTAELDDAELRYRDEASLESRRRDPGILAVRAAFGYLGVLGIAAALAAMVGLGLYLSARRRARALGAVMTKSMGLSSARAALVTVSELVAVLGIAVGAAFVTVPFVVRRSSSRFDPAPDLPPDVTVSVEWGLLIAVATVAVAVIAAVVWLAEWRGDRRSSGEVLRDER